MLRRVTGLCACLAFAFGAGAFAHAILVQSQPAPGATLPPGRVALVLRYNSRIDAFRSRLTLTQPDGSHAVLPIAPASAPDELRSDTLLRPGAYSLRWQVLAVDGHITRGDVPFRVQP